MQWMRRGGGNQSGDDRGSGNDKGVHKREAGGDMFHSGSGPFPVAVGRVDAGSNRAPSQDFDHLLLSL